MKEFRLPDPGEGLVEAEIVSWLVSVGDTVKVNDPLLEIETSKSVVELPSPYEGTVAKILVSEGDLVDVGTVIVTIDDGTGPAADSGDSAEAEAAEAPAAEPAASAPAAASEPAAPAEAPAAEAPAATGEEREAVLVGYGVKPGKVARRPRKETEAPAPAAPAPAAAAPNAAAPVQRPGLPAHRLASPVVRRLARDLGIDLESVTGSGEGGIITKDDIQLAAAGAAGIVAEHDGERVPLRGPRRAMVRSMTASSQIPQATVIAHVDVTETMRLVEALRKRKEFDGVRVSPLLVFCKVACLAIARNPDINATLDVEHDEIVRRTDVNLGIAAATPRGLVVPNVKAANTLSLLELATRINEIVVRAREGRITPVDVADGTFTITNVGPFGIEGGLPMLNPGESAIMCLGTIQRRPWVVGTGDDERVEPRSVCMVSLSFDHRLVDGELGSRFMGDIATILADPALALMF